MFYITRSKVSTLFSGGVGVDPPTVVWASLSSISNTNSFLNLLTGKKAKNIYNVNYYLYLEVFQYFSKR